MFETVLKINRFDIPLKSVQSSSCFNEFLFNSNGLNLILCRVQDVAKRTLKDNLSPGPSLIIKDHL